MIITTIKLHGQPHKRKEIVQTVTGLADGMAKYEGCDNASLYQDIHDKDIFYFMEEWKTALDFERYKKSNSYAVLFGLESLLVEALDIKHAVKCITGKKISDE